MAQPSSEFYSLFSPPEILALIQALELRREIPLKYAYKGRGAKIWDNFYQKYILPNWYRRSSTEIDLLNQNFEYINGSQQNCSQVNLVDVGAGNSYPAKKVTSRLAKLGKINKYIALDISQELLEVSKDNFTKWFPLIDFESYLIDIETNPIAREITDYGHDICSIFMHLGVTMGNHRDRNRVLQNFRDSMSKNDFLVFTNEIGSNAEWDGNLRGGCKYHVEGIYKWITSQMGIPPQACELLRKYDSVTDSITANIKFHHKHTFTFNQLGLNKNVEIAAGEEITIWRHHKYQMPELIQELETAGLELTHFACNQYRSHIMTFCQVANS